MRAKRARHPARFLGAEPKTALRPRWPSAGPGNQKSATSLCHISSSPVSSRSLWSKGGRVHRLECDLRGAWIRPATAGPDELASPKDWIRDAKLDVVRGSR